MRCSPCKNSDLWREKNDYFEFCDSVVKIIALRFLAQADNGLISPNSSS